MTVPTRFSAANPACQCHDQGMNTAAPSITANDGLAALRVVAAVYGWVGIGAPDPNVAALVHDQKLGDVVLAHAVHGTVHGLVLGDGLDRVELGGLPGEGADSARPAEIGMLAILAKSYVFVHQRPRVAILPAVPFGVTEAQQPVPVFCADAERRHFHIALQQRINKRAARELGMLNRGVAPVMVTTIQ